MSISIKTENGIVTVANTGGTGGATVWEGTAAEFDIQADTIPDGSIVNIIDDVESVGDINSLLDAINGTADAPVIGYNISLEESKTGNKYLDKDIYICMYPFTRAGVPSNGVTLTTSDIPNLLEMENILDIKYIRDNSSLIVHANGYFSNATTYWMSSHFGPSADSTGKLIFEYTKKEVE